VIHVGKRFLTEVFLSAVGLKEVELDIAEVGLVVVHVCHGAPRVGAV